MPKTLWNPSKMVIIGTFANFCFLSYFSNKETCEKSLIIYFPNFYETQAHSFKTLSNYVSCREHRLSSLSFLCIVLPL
jgi:membrane-bound acyltransferase YfiQ involved in biofilm formation